MVPVCIRLFFYLFRDVIHKPYSHGATTSQFVIEKKKAKQNNPGTPDAQKKKKWRQVSQVS